jgi:hypothetical protein
MGHASEVQPFRVLPFEVVIDPNSLEPLLEVL